MLLLISFFILFAFVGRRYFPNQTRGIYFWNNYRSFSLVGRRGGRFQPVGIYFRLTPYFYSSYSALHHRYLLLLVPRSLLLLLITVALIASSLQTNKNQIQFFPLTAAEVGQHTLTLSHTQKKRFSSSDSTAANSLFFCLNCFLYYSAPNSQLPSAPHLNLINYWHLKNRRFRGFPIFGANLNIFSQSFQCCVPYLNIYTHTM